MLALHQLASFRTFPQVGTKHRPMTPIIRSSIWRTDARSIFGNNGRLDIHPGSVWMVLPSAIFLRARFSNGANLQCDRMLQAELRK